MTKDFLKLVGIVTEKLSSKEFKIKLSDSRLSSREVIATTAASLRSESRRKLKRLNIVEGIRVLVEISPGELLNKSARGRIIQRFD